MWLTVVVFSSLLAAAIAVSDDQIVRVQEGDYYITYARDSKFNGFDLSFKKKDDLFLRDDRYPQIWRLYYPNFAEPHFILQNMWLGIDGDGHPWFQFFAQVSQDHIELEIADPTLWVAFEAAEPDTYYIRTAQQPYKWIARPFGDSSGKIAVRNHQQLNEVFNFKLLE